MNQRVKPRPDNGIRKLARKISGNGPGWLKGVRWVVTLGVAGTVLGAITFFVLYQLIDIPDPNADFETQTTNVYFSDGKHRLGTFATQDRQNVTLDKVPAEMQAAVIAAEDRTFYTNRGIDIKGIIRAARNNATSGQITGGGSTITQQYVKILYLSQEQSYTRKVREAILSIKIHNKLSKKEILEGYLNTIYFGNGAYGVEVASQTYFGTSVSDLTYDEAAALATILNQPSYYDPYSDGGAKRMVPRYDYVLEGMAKSGAITAAQRAKAQDNLPAFAKRKDNNRFKGPNGYLLRLVQKQLQALKFSDSDILGGGLNIRTTIGYQKQKDAIRAINAVRPAGHKKLHAALVSVVPGTGAVRAMYGGPDYLKSQINWATVGTQPGSTFKAFALVAALEDGFSLKTKLNGSSPLHIGGNVVENQGDSGGESFGNVTLERATQKSINTAYVDLTRKLSGTGDKAGDDTSDISIGTQKIRDAANEAGIPTSITDKFDPAAAVTPLGYVPVPPVDMANAYATLAAGGKKADWYVIDKVTDPNGSVLHQHKVQTEQSIPEDVDGDAIAAMRKVVNSGAAGTGSRARTLCPTAGKTGTATAGANNNQHVSSSWFVGYTPKLATAVMYNRGVGNEDLEGYLIPFYGGTFPAMTFKAYMDAAINPTSCGIFIPPGNIRATKGQIYSTPAPKKKKHSSGSGGSSGNGNNGNGKGGPTGSPTPTGDPTSPGNDTNPGNGFLDGH